MKDEACAHRIAIIGAGPSGLFIYKKLIESGRKDIVIDIFDKDAQLGAGMPYSTKGANQEHVTNVSDNEIPNIVTHIAEWVKTQPKELLEKFDIDPDRFNEYKVLPRLFFGLYLSAQFELLLSKAEQMGIVTKIHQQSKVTDIIDQPDRKEVWIKINGMEILKYHKAIICTGHSWPKENEGNIPDYYDSPYPPSKLELKLDHTVAIRGSSLTAIDAIRTLSRQNGVFKKDAASKLIYHLNKDSQGFKIVMHSRGGFLPGLRFHLEDPHLSKSAMLTNEQINAHISSNEGFLSLDFIFNEDFKKIIQKKDKDLYKQIKDMNMEAFVGLMMDQRKNIDAFQLFKAEYAEAEKSIKRRESVYWKELLAILSFAMNYPAKHFSAEDMLRLQKVLMPLISIVIAFVPQGSALELIALHDAGLLDIISVGDDSHIEAQPSGGIVYHYSNDMHQKKAVHYKTFVDCIGQRHLSYDDFPFKSLREQKVISPSRLRFRSSDAGRLAVENGDKNVEHATDGEYYLKVPGITINDDFQLVDDQGTYNTRIFMMAVAYIGGFNPDYSGLDFCEAASERIVKALGKEYD